jgi:acetyl esterase
VPPLAATSEATDGDRRGKAAGFLGQLAETGMKPLHEMTPDEARAVGAPLRDLYGPGPDVLTRPISADRRGRRRVRRPCWRRRAQVGSLVVYYHGGGW